MFGLAVGNGGLEIWSRDDRDELAISGSYYQGLPSFEFISQHVRFPKGAGLPGACWKEDRPRIIAQPQTAPDFIRSFDRDPAHLGDCVGLPIGREYGFPAAILLLLSDENLPLALKLDVWHKQSESSSSDEIVFSGTRPETANATWCQAICDQLIESPNALLLDQSSALLPNNYQSGLFLPFYDGKDLTDVFVVLF